MKDVVVDDCCRGFRVQDCTGVYVYRCSTSGVADNAFYWASGTYVSSTSDSAGCKDCLRHVHGHRLGERGIHADRHARRVRR